MNFFYELVLRLQKESPKFFVIVRYGSAVLALLSWFIQKIMADKVWMPHSADKVETICGYFITAGITLWSSSFLPTKHSLEQNNTINDDTGTTNQN